MGRKPEAPRAAEPPKRKMTPEEQSELFIKTARELGVDETGAEFERAFAKVAAPILRKPTGKAKKAAD